MTFQELKNEIIQDAEKKYLDEIKKLKEENKNFQKALKDIKNQIKKNKKSNDKK